MTDEKALRIFKDMVKLYNTEKPGQLWAAFNALSLQEKKDFIAILKGLLTFHAITEKQKWILAQATGTEFIPRPKPEWMED
jgi:hypothetical protein